MLIHLIKKRFWVWFRFQKETAEKLRSSNCEIWPLSHEQKPGDINKAFEISNIMIERFPISNIMFVELYILDEWNDSFLGKLKALGKQFVDTILPVMTSIFRYETAVAAAQHAPKTVEEFSILERFGDQISNCKLVLVYQWNFKDKLWVYLMFIFSNFTICRRKKSVNKWCSKDYGLEVCPVTKNKKSSLTTITVSTGI